MFQINTFYIFNLHNIVCQLHISKTGKNGLIQWEGNYFYSTVEVTVISKIITCLKLNQNFNPNP